MDRRYTDEWSDEVKRIDLSDWSDWGLWANWADKFDWQNGTDFTAQDVIIWREPILVNLTARKPQKRNKWIVTGERLVIGHIRKIDKIWVYITVIYSEGNDPLKRDEKIKRRSMNIARNGVKRWPRADRLSEYAGQRNVHSSTPALNAETSAVKPKLNSRFLKPRGMDKPPSLKP